MRLSSALPKEVLKMAMESILGHKFRSFLTILGIVVGVITAIVVASILLGLRQNIVAMIEEYGTNNIYAFHLTTGFGPPNREERLRKPLTEADAAAILAQTNAIEDISMVRPSIGSFGDGFDDNLIYEGRNYRWALTDGVTPNLMNITNVVLTEGRFITENDNSQRRNVLVLGVNAAEALFPDKEGDRVGKMVRMNGMTWEVIGVLEKRKAGFFGENEEDRKVYMPFRTAQKVAPQRDYIVHIIKARSDKVQTALEDAEAVLRQRRGVKYGEANNFDIKTADAFIEQFDAILGGIGGAAIAISCLGLLVGGIGVMNIMLVSVTERTKEIGVRKAVGATKGAIVLQFLLEAMTLTFFGGVVGVVTAIGIAQLVMLLVPSLPASIASWSIVLALFVSVMVGLIFGVLPARRAANLDPIECLRYE
ncbi:MAG: ABC transporter permease [Acidobacteria bacterium]|nr:MAG: ABC transporter permease [Acidobacteriota bacterium]REK02146.1 MAG: ABC transporter permease [Acidobacteriota bacterium]REK14052.1 MAG: ABC transporter permease [Acidobacteriota bacterium]REK42047.1 MAG: ABC transporter permease [Acidobacteriota bacterium]